MEEITVVPVPDEAAVTVIPDLPPPEATSAVQVFGRFRHGTSAAAQLTGAHIAPWGKKAEMFEEVHTILVQSHQYKSCKTDRMAASTVKTVQDRFNNFVLERKAANRANEKASGVAEEYGEKESLIDIVVNQMHEKKKKAAEEKNEKRALESRLRSAGEEV
eukprot:IDg22844t1